MTIQVADPFEYNSQKYWHIRTNSGELFTPDVLELQPQAISTECKRGYVADFAVMQQRLGLANLEVYLGRWDTDYSFVSTVGPVINGVHPVVNHERHSHNYYQGINYPLNYSGGIILGRSPIPQISYESRASIARSRQTYWRYRSYCPWIYQDVVELRFESGKLTEVNDLVVAMYEIQKSLRQEYGAYQNQNRNQSNRKSRKQKKARKHQNSQHQSHTNAIPERDSTRELIDQTVDKSYDGF